QGDGDRALKRLAPKQAGGFEVHLVSLAIGQRGDERADAREILGAGAVVVLLRAAGEAVRPGDRAGRGGDKTVAARAAEFVGRADHPAGRAGPGGGEFAEPLGGVAKKWRTARVAEGREVGPRLDDAGLVVGGHDDRGARAGIERGGERGGGDAAAGAGADGRGAAGEAAGAGGGTAGGFGR